MQGTPQATSFFHVHIQKTGHNSTETSFNIIGREDQGMARTIKESIYIRVNNPTLNQNIGKYNHSHLWDRVILTPQGINCTLPSSQAHKHNSGSNHVPTLMYLTSMCTKTV